LGPYEDDADPNRGGDRGHGEPAAVRIRERVETDALDLLRIPAFALSMVASICSFAAQMIAYVALPFYFHDALGFSETRTGFLMTRNPQEVERQQRRREPDLGPYEDDADPNRGGDRGHGEPAAVRSGPGCSSSTCRSGWWRWRWARARCRERPAPPGACPDPRTRRDRRSAARR
jgi:hypothetical protein